MTATLGSVDRSVLVKRVIWLLSVQEMVGTGDPIEVQEMFTLPPSLTVTTSAPLLTLVLALTAAKERGVIRRTMKCGHLPNKITSKKISTGVWLDIGAASKVASYIPRSSIVVLSA